MIKGVSVFPIRVIVEDMNGKMHTYAPATHVECNQTDTAPTILVYDGSEIIGDHVGYKSYTVEQMIPEIEEYKGEGFPL